MTTRRDFLKTTAVTAGALALAANVHAAGSDQIKVGIVGCGGRGKGAGKNLFTEKPVAVDGTGIRKVFDAYDASMKKGLKIVAGTQRRHQGPYLETVKRLHDGAIGSIVAGHCHWNQSNIWFRKREKG